MLNWSRHLYLGNHIKKYEQRIRQRLDEGKIDVGHYLITYAVNEMDQLDIISTIKLTAYQREHLPPIVGLAGTRQEAYELLVHITDDCLKATGDVDLRRYLERRG